MRRAQSVPVSITSHPYDTRWPELYRREATRIRRLLGVIALSIDHIGSTAVPGLAAKPRIDIDLVVPDSADEVAYVPALERGGYVVVIREPEWHERRVLKGPDTDVNLHVFRLTRRNWSAINAFGTGFGHTPTIVSGTAR